MHSTAALTALRGIYAPVLTPFDSDLRPDAVRFVAHCQWLVRHGARLAVFGTNSEAASIPVDERLRLTDAVLEAGVPPDRLLPGTGSCALGDAVTLTRHADRAGVAGVLVLPPFYYKPASDDGLFAFYAELIERVGSARLRLLLYHIPQLTGVPISTALIERLRARYPDTVVGLKDSSGDWSYSQALLERFGSLAGVRSASVAELAAVPGFDLNKALRQLGGQVGIVEKVLRSFVRNYAEGEAGLLTAGAQDSRSTWPHLCHSLRGACETNGAASLAQALKDFERELEGDADIAALSVQARALNAALIDLVTALSAALDGPTAQSR